MREQAVMFWYPRNGEHPNVRTVTVVLYGCTSQCTTLLSVFFFLCCVDRKEKAWVGVQPPNQAIACWMLDACSLVHLFIFS